MTTTLALQRFGDLAASELRKLTSLMSNRVILGVTVVAMIILGVTVVAMIGLALLGSEFDLHEGRRLLPPGTPFHPTIVPLRRAANPTAPRRRGASGSRDKRRPPRLSWRKFGDDGHWCGFFDLSLDGGSLAKRGANVIEAKDAYGNCNRAV